MSNILRVASACAVALFVASGALAASQCPTALQFEPAADGTTIDLGWTGLLHGTPATGYALRLGVTCEAAAPPCGTCTIDGITATAGGTNRRCANDTSTICTPATEVADCGAPASCTFFAAPPTAISSGGIAVCVTNAVPGTVSGTVDVESGAFAPVVPLRTTVHIGTYDRPCPRCEGDATPNDGMRDGTCSGGDRDGLACDAQAVQAFAQFGTTSFDCPPPAGAAVGTPVNGPLTLTTGTSSRTLTAASPNCRDGSGRKCLCDTCNDAAAEPCASNADCPTGGICGGRRCFGGANVGAPCVNNSTCAGGGVCITAGEPSRPSACFAGCVPTSADGTGQCAADDVVDQRCSSASPYPQVPCGTDADCGGPPGSCSVLPRKCFAGNGAIGSTISVTGIASPPIDGVADAVTLGGFTCAGATSSSAVNASTGLPGIARTSMTGRLTFAEKIVASVVAPGGTVTTAGTPPASIVETTLTTPVGGEVLLVDTFPPDAPLGDAFIGRLIRIATPDASAASPVQIAFEIAASAVPGQRAPTIDAFRNGVGPIADCVGGAEASPEPCVSGRTRLGNGTFRLEVLTAVATGDWTFSSSDPAYCPSAPTTCRQPAKPGKAPLLLVDSATDEKDQLEWTWRPGTTTTKAELGDPVTSDDYSLCLYDSTGLRAMRIAPAGGTCAGKPCWTKKPSGFAYDDASYGAAGLVQIKLKADAHDRAEVVVKGRGPNLLPPSPSSIAGPLVVQLRNVTTGLCFGATYSPAFKKLDATTLKDNAD